MLQSSVTQLPADALPGHDRLGTILAALTDLGFDPPPRLGHIGASIGGVSLCVPVAAIVGARPDARVFQNELATMLAHGLPVCLNVADFPAGMSMIEAWHRCCEEIQKNLARRGLSTGGIAVCMQAHCMPLEAYCLITDAVLGAGPRYVLLDSLQMREGGDRAVAARALQNWRFLWRHRHGPRAVVPVYGGLARSACRLLSDEVAATIAPPAALQAPHKTAWVSAGLSLTGFATPRGSIDWQRLAHSIAAMLPLADTLFEVAHWPQAGQAADACHNRRLALRLTDLGDLVAITGRCPQNAADVEWLLGIVRRIRAMLQKHSAALARTRSLLPALEQSNPVAAWPSGPQKDRWEMQWRTALERSALRHRSLLALAPGSVLPAARACTRDYGNLLPVLACADTWAFDNSSPMSGCSAREFRDFHRRAHATIQSAERASFVADRV